eukprot:765385-Hanusia_phi.AAC.2
MADTNKTKDISPQLRYYRDKIARDKDFYIGELQRSNEYIKNRYKTDEEFRKKMIENAKRRHAKMKLEKDIQMTS